MYSAYAPYWMFLLLIAFINAIMVHLIQLSTLSTKWWKLI